MRTDGITLLIPIEAFVVLAALLLWRIGRSLLTDQEKWK
jgi:hypothetical protein